VDELGREQSPRDDLDLFLEEQLQDEKFRAAFEDSEARASLLRHLARRRSIRSISQAMVARFMGTTQSAVSDLEAGSTDPRLSTLQRYARAIGCRLQICVKDYSGAWQPGPADEAVEIRPVNVSFSDPDRRDWRIVANRTIIQVGDIANTAGPINCEDTSFA
jgi:transcriptional regulator with XRE-family HTH domain